MDELQRMMQEREARRQELMVQLLVLWRTTQRFAKQGDVPESMVAQASKVEAAYNIWQGDK